VTTGAIRRANLQSNRHHQQISTHILPAGCPSCHPTNSVKAKLLSIIDLALNIL